MVDFENSSVKHWNDLIMYSFMVKIMRLTVKNPSTKEVYYCTKEVNCRPRGQRTVGAQRAAILQRHRAAVRGRALGRHLLERRIEWLHRVIVPDKGAVHGITGDVGRFAGCKTIPLQREP